jgi:hypothetical protein
MKLFVHPIAQSQFALNAVGTQILDSERHIMEVERLLGGWYGPIEFPEDGQGRFLVPEHTWTNVLPGEVSRKGLHPTAYKAVEHRGEMILAADRDRVTLGDPTAVYVIVYTAEAFMADTQTSAEEKAAFEAAGYTHCLVVTLAVKGPPALSSHRFVRNLAGGNAAYAAKTREDLVAEAKEIEGYERDWIVVA